MSAAQHTEGPWRWEFNEQGKKVHLVGGRPRFDLTIMDCCRWGMTGGGIRLRQPDAPGMNIMHKLHERRDWIAPFAGRAHHADWCASVIHPDMRLIEAAPDLLAACQAAWNCIAELPPTQARVEVVQMLQAAIEKGAGQQP